MVAGASVFQERCVACHSDPTDDVVPRLPSSLLRRSFGEDEERLRRYIVESIVDPDREKNEYWMSMPKFSFWPWEVTAVTNYLMSQVALLRGEAGKQPSGR
ncbi:MAG: c-type cytochrome [Planctomycetes bacterium]|nr:c-type cytochrome [Planctomycetota bacterium]